MSSPDAKDDLQAAQAHLESALEAPAFSKALRKDLAAIVTALRKLIAKVPVV